MSRTIVVTGSASGIGAATRTRLEAAGDRVVGVDLRDAEVEVDLATTEGRRALVEEVRASTDGRIDGIVANAGVDAFLPVTVAVNHFGAVATLEGLRPLLAGSEAPRAVATCSVALLRVVSPPLVEACLAGDEGAALELAAAMGEDPTIYGSTKRALARWLRSAAPTPAWAGAGIALNAVAPGVVRTPMTAGLLGDDDLRAMVDAAVPMPFGGYLEAEDVAAAICWLVGPGCRGTTGQVLFVDGGADVSTRGDDVW